MRHYTAPMIRLVVANLLRRKVRTALTMGSFAVALFLFALLAIVRGALQQGVHIAGADRLVVVNRGSIIQPLPLAYRDRLAQIPGVSQVTFATWFGGLYRDERHSFAQFAIDRASYRQMFPECIVSDDQWLSFLADREGAIIGTALAERFGWRVGDRIPIKGAVYPGAWEFNIRGVYRGQRAQDDTTQLWLHWDYLDERRSIGKGLVGWYTVRIADPHDAARLIQTIDRQFANSAFETKTETEKAFAASWARRIGNVALLMLSIGAVVFVTLLLVTGNMMAIAVRERTREIAVLKAVGFSDVSLLKLVIAETLVIALVGGGLGLAMAKLFTLRGDPTGGLLPFFHLPASAIVTGLALALFVGLLAAALPALSAGRLRVVDALRRI
jgi:putative ABC transport system permease protein